MRPNEKGRCRVSTVASMAPPVLEVLLGHTSAETAYVVDDYPYGFRVRTKIRYWMETATKGASRNKVRLVSSTLNPNTGRWNKPKASTYADAGWMYLDHRNGHVAWWSLSYYDLVKGIAKTKAAGIWDGLPTDVRFDLLDKAAVVRARVMTEYHAEWDAVVDKVREAVKSHGDVPDLYDKCGFDPDAKVWRSDYDLALSLVKAEEFKDYTLPVVA